jgi:hypothetical protein
MRGAGYMQSSAQQPAAYICAALVLLRDVSSISIVCHISESLSYPTVGKINRPGMLVGTVTCNVSVWCTVLSHSSHTSHQQPTQHSCSLNLMSFQVHVIFFRTADGTDGRQPAASSGNVQGSRCGKHDMVARLYFPPAVRA